MKILDRYVLRSFLEPFLICFLGFFSIWLVFDIQDNLTTYQQGKPSLKMLLGFYLTQVPAFLNLVIPVALLLALLFSLSRMSRSNEIISQLTAGLSVTRVLMPLFGVGLACTALLWWLNREVAPHADSIKKVALEQIARGRKTMTQEAIEAHLFKDRKTLRTWYAEKYRMGTNSFQGVLILQQDDAENIIKKWYAKRAEWDARTGAWVLISGMAIEFTPEGDEVKRDLYLTSAIQIKDWPETPWRISSSNLDPQNLSVAELKLYLEQNHDFPPLSLAPYRTYLEYREALPWNAFVVVLIGAPLGIVFNRRGVLGGVAGAVFIFAGMTFFTHLCLALGKGMRISPFAAAWTPNIAIAIIGIIMLYMRGSNRDFASLFMRRVR